MIEAVIEKWHRFVTGALPEELDVLLADDVVFYSPILYTPQRGKALASMYLSAAAVALSGDGADGAFRYTKQVLTGDIAVLEFETTVNGKYVNGVDIIRCDDTDHIVEFRVMIRPLQAVHIVHEQMRAMLEAITPQGG